MKHIPLGNNLYAQVDDADYEALSQHSWCRVGIYAARTVYKGGKHTVYMQCEIMGTAMVDHEDGNGLNNQRYNLRPCTRFQNNCNTRKRNGTTSKFKGVHKRVDNNKYRAYIRVSGNLIHLGQRDTEIEAAKLYDAAAIQHFGEFAKLNFEAQGE